MLKRNFAKKGRDRSNPGKREKHGKFNARSPNNGEQEKRNRNRRRSEGRNGTTKKSRQRTPPTNETENCTGKEWPTLDEQRKYPKHLFKRRQRFLFPLRRYQKENTTKFQVGEFSVPTQRPRNNQSVIGGKEHYDTIIVPGTQNG